MTRFIVRPFIFYGICVFFSLFFLTKPGYSDKVTSNNKSALKPAVKINQGPIKKSMKDNESSREKNAGGTTIRSVVVTTWRSGSTFLGDVLDSVPGNFHYYEPLLNFGDIQIRGPPHAKTAVKQLKDQLTCNFSDLKSYLEHGKTQKYVHSNNRRWWKKCTAFKPYQCHNATLIEDFCRKSPLVSMKTVRLRLKLAEQLLQDESLNVRMVLLVRDPRAVMNSRRKTIFCKKSPDCIDPHLLCADMASNYATASELLVKYPYTFNVLRYEDFALDTKKGSQELFEFLGREFHPEVIKFLNTHTTKNAANPYSTYRLSKEIPFHWKTEMQFKKVDEIQQACSEAMSYWGYNPARDPDHLLSKDFNPVGDYSLP